jgi:hypothetical protein
MEGEELKALNDINDIYSHEYNIPFVIQDYVLLELISPLLRMIRLVLLWASILLLLA